MSAPHQLRVEHLGDAGLGIGERRPRLSWQLPDGASAQTGYQLELNGAPQERVEASECVLTPWRHDPLGSAARGVAGQGVDRRRRE